MGTTLTDDKSFWLLLPHSAGDGGAASKFGELEEGAAPKRRYLRHKVGFGQCPGFTPIDPNGLLMKIPRGTKRAQFGPEPTLMNRIDGESTTALSLITSLPNSITR